MRWKVRAGSLGGVRGVLMAAVVALAVGACASGGQSSGPTPSEIDRMTRPPDDQILLTVNNEYRQGVLVRYKFATGQTRRLGNVGPNRREKFLIRPLVGNLIFQVEYSTGRNAESNALQVFPGETYTLLIRDNFTPLLVQTR